MSQFCNLCSSSKGNSTYLSSGGTAVLVDVGISFRALTQTLLNQGLSAADLSAVFITHEHSDHISGLKTLLKKLRLPVYASCGTLEYLCRRDFVPPGSTLIECNGSMAVGEVEVTPFSIPHDASEPTGFRFELPDGRSVAMATDLGCITDEVRWGITGCDLVMLESNYDPGMLDCSHYPYHLKRRIKGKFGHLSNEDCATELTRLVQSGTTRLVLGHLSEQNNMPDLAYHAGKAALEILAMQENLDYILKVAPARAPREVLIF